MRFLLWTTLSILFFGTPLTAHADGWTFPSVEVGARAAYSRITFFRGSGVQGSGKLRSKNGFAGGLSSHYELHATETVRLGVQAEILFAQRGAKGEYEGRIIGDWQLNYLELPVLGRFLLPVSSAFGPYIVAGPRFGLLLSAESTDVNGNARDESDGTNKFDVGFSVGAGALFHAGSRMVLSLEGRYDQSLMNRIDDSVDTTADQRHRAFFLMLGVSMGIGSPTRTSAP
jgi:opacity protein-like surface antigen